MRPGSALARLPGNSKTAWKKAQFADNGELVVVLSNGESQHFQLSKLAAGQSRDVFACSKTMVAKLEVQAHPNADKCVIDQVHHYGGRNEWRTNEHEWNCLRSSAAPGFAPALCEPQFVYGHVANMHGADVPVSVLFVERLPGSDLQNCFENAVAAKDTGSVGMVLRNGLQAIFRRLLRRRHAPRQLGDLVALWHRCHL